MSLEHHRLKSDHDGGLVESNGNSTKFSSSTLSSSPQKNLITHHIPIDGQIFLHQATNKIKSRTNQFSIYSNNNNMTAFTSTASPTPVRSSKLLVLQQSPHANGHMQHETFIAENNMNGTATIVGSASSNNGNTQHIGDNIVLVTTTDHHQMEITNSDHDIINNNNILSMANANGGTTIQGSVTTSGAPTTTTTTDEELTPLHWLHDKNLLKGINLSCNKAQSRPDSPNRHVSGGLLTPTSDFVEDSSISEDNNSSVHSNYEQQHGSICSLEASPKSTNHINTSHTSYYNNNNNNTPQNLSVINRSVNNISPLSSSSLSTTTIPITTNAIEINSNYIQRQQQLQQFNTSSASSPTPSTSSSNSASTLSSLSPTNLTITVSSSSNTSNSSNSSVSPHHTHFHKKYLRTQQQQIQEHHHHQSEGKTLTITTEEIVRQQLQQQFVAPIVNYSTLKPELNKIQKSDMDCDEYENPYKNSGYSTPQSYSSSPVPDHDLSNSKYEMTTPPKSNVQTKDKHPNNLPYDPQLHTNSKPPYSFSCLIFMAIEDSPTKALPVKEIYSWITQHFPYFKTAPNGWKNSVRHNLSLNKSFQKVEKAANLGKGSLWMVDDQYRPNLIQALTRSPFHPISPSIEKSVMKAANSMPSSNRSTPNKNFTNGNAVVQQGILKDGSRLPNPEHFPFLARRLAAMENEPEQITYTNGMSFNPTNGMVIGGERTEDDVKVWCADSIDDVNAAAAMLALKHGPKIFTEVFQDGHPPIITTSPSEDHTYSSAINGANGVRSGSSSDANSNGTSSDAAYESGEESHNNQTFHDTEEQRRLAEGADALLNLAGITTNNYHCDTTITTNNTPTRNSAVKRLGSPEFNSAPHPYYSAANQTNITHNYSSPPKKHKSRMLKTKLKKKASWLR